MMMMMMQAATRHNFGSRVTRCSPFQGSFPLSRADTQVRRWFSMRWTALLTLLQAAGKFVTCTSLHREIEQCFFVLEQPCSHRICRLVGFVCDAIGGHGTVQ